ncbi:MAG: diguanylate cyclase, partial [Spirochaetales bacterium]|nr:diguanylate cyclase [Spirochaetales bacterium]
RYDSQTDSFEHWTKRDGLPSNIVLGLLEGEPGMIWASTTSGLAVLDPESGRWRPFYDQSRLRYGEFTAGRYKSRAGILYFGALNALYRIDPSRVVYSEDVQPVRITRIQVDNNDLDGALAPWYMEEIRVRWHEANLSLEFAALDYGDPFRVQYAYMLEGFDSDWTYSGQRSYASYTNLPGGRSYVFKVKASNGAGEWSEEATSLAVIVSTAPWVTWWAISLYLIAASGGVWMFVVVRSRALLKDQVDELSVLKRQLELANVRLEQLASHDGLTGLLNRRALDAELLRRHTAAASLVEPISVLMIDIDYFKNFNDRYGHQLGDECLIAVCARIGESLERPQDSIARYGGEEFAAILPGTDEAGARRVAERVRTAVEALGIVHEASHISRVVTVSVGYVSRVPVPGDDPARLMDLADEALYRAKNAGRNRISD